MPFCKDNEGGSFVRTKLLVPVSSIFDFTIDEYVSVDLPLRICRSVDAHFHFIHFHFHSSNFRASGAHTVVKKPFLMRGTQLLGLRRYDCPLLSLYFIAPIRLFG